MTSDTVGGISQPRENDTGEPMDRAFSEISNRVQQTSRCAADIIVPRKDIIEIEVSIHTL